MTIDYHIDTRILDGTQPRDLDEAAACLRNGGLVAFPTETVYGLGADALNPEAVARVFSVKGRPADNPLIVHVRGLDIVPRFTVGVPDKARILAEHVWPGPLTLVLERNDLVPDIVTAGLDTIALRVPRHPLTEDLLRRFEGGIVGPSANVSGRPSPTTARHVAEDLAGRIEMILDGGSTVYGLESTVVDCTIDPPAILRLGALSREEVERLIGPLQTADAVQRTRSPGTRHRHYAPRAQVMVFPEGDEAGLKGMLQEVHSRGGGVRVITHSPALAQFNAAHTAHQRIASIESLAKHLYEFLRDADKEGLAAIIVEGTADRGIGSALMDRLRRASESDTAH